MSRITLTLNQNNDKVENVVFDDIEHLFVDHSADDDLDANIYLSISLIVYILIITTNGILLYFFINQPNKTFLDWMMVCDTLLCISNIFGIGNIYKVLQSVEFCYFIPFFIYFTNICNRLLTVGIVIYRSESTFNIIINIITYNFWIKWYNKMVFIFTVQIIQIH